MSGSERCAAAERCLGFDHREHLAAEVEDGPLCEDELLAGERAVQALVWTYGDLEQLQLPSLGNRGDGQPGASDEHRTPLNLAAEALQAEIHRVLTTWEDVVREREKLSDSVTSRVRAGWAVQAAVQILRPRVRLLARIGPVVLAGYPGLGDDEARVAGLGPFIPEAASFDGAVWAEVPGWRGVLDFARLHRWAKVLLGLAPTKPEVCDGVPCRSCDLKALYREPGEDTVRCGACKDRYTAKEYRDWAKLRGYFICSTCDMKIEAVGDPDGEGFAVAKPCGHLVAVERKQPGRVKLVSAHVGRKESAA